MNEWQLMSISLFIHERLHPQPHSLWEFLKLMDTSLCIFFIARRDNSYVFGYEQHIAVQGHTVKR